MIPLLDIALVTTIKKEFPNYDVVWSPVTQAVRAMSVSAAQKSLNFPSLCVFRSSEEAAENLNAMPMQTVGHRYKLSEDAKDLTMMRRKNVYAIYDIQAIAFKQSEINEINRILTFFHWNTPIPVKIDNVEYNFRIEYSSPAYEQVFDEHSEKVRYHILSYQYRILAFWMTPTAAKPVLEVILPFYEKVTSGDPILLETSTLEANVTVVPLEV